MRDFTHATHSVAWEISDGWIRGTVTCDGDESSWCHQTCRTCYGELWSDDEHVHDWVAGPECNAALWISEDGITETHVGPPHPVSDGPVNVEWDGSNWVWSYPEPES